jgi:hypothetical protein
MPKVHIGHALLYHLKIATQVALSKIATQNNQKPKIATQVALFRDGHGSQSIAGGCEQVGNTHEVLKIQAKYHVMAYI